MSTIVSVRIESWGGKFIVVGEFGKTVEIPRHECDTYGEALYELAKIARREVVRYESGIDRGFNR